MKVTTIGIVALAGAALATTMFVSPATADRASDAATRYASSIYAQQLGLPTDYFEYQHALQRSNERSTRRPSLWRSSNRGWPSWRNQSYRNYNYSNYNAFDPSYNQYGTNYGPGARIDSWY